MATAWLVAGVVVLSIAIGVLLMLVIFQWRNNARLEGRIQSLGQMLRNVPKRKSDKIVE